jgi:hypothetical protein
LALYNAFVLLDVKTMSAIARSWSFLSPLLAAMLLAGCAASAKSPTLIQLIQSTGPASMRLKPQWIGEAHDSLRTGNFAGDQSGRNPSNYKLHFDWFIYPYKPYGQSSPSTIICQSSDGRNPSNIYIWRASLPSDKELTQATTAADLENSLGGAQGLADAWGSDTEMHTTQYWQFFRTVDAGTIQTLSIRCTITWQPPEKTRRIEGLLIVRGIARPD